MIKVFQQGDPEREAFLTRLKGRQVEPPPEIETSVRAILAGVKAKGDAALFEYAKEFDGALLSAGAIRAKEAEVQAAYQAIPPKALEALKTAHARILAYHEKQRRPSWFMEEEGAILGQVVRPLERVGIYVPGGKATYPSTVLMNATPAAVAKVPSIVMCTPVGPDLTVNPAILVAADLAGVKEVYKVGGAQAIAALAYGTESIPEVDKVVGPGNIYVTTAKRLLYGQVGIDFLAGPSEMLVLADDSANPASVAVDLLAQAEHDPLASALLLTPSSTLADAVLKELKGQVADLPRREIVEASLGQWGAIILVEDLDEAVALANQVAPEHIELLVEDPWALLPFIKKAGAVFLGASSPGAAGDYVAGPNHVLPTGGTARFFSPLSVEDFQRRSSVVAFSSKKLEELGPSIIELAMLEGLEAHARSVKVRRKDT
ncbi:MAG: histidinol dehydrogenase [candidate division NC10 bacterium]|nr:histidinol dehydrogenase [candidate division NC10 bacterium]